MTRAWKGVRFGTDEPLEVYDLAGNPAEKRDVSADRPKVAQCKGMLFTEGEPR